ncbi:MAG: DUF4011 domain-containing protein [Chlorobium phaeovibrioides]|nr:DUF4011 domain-containing protein [Chlorobium phaeovibrioides]
MEEQHTGEYQANETDAIIGTIFSGTITVTDAIERIRTRLLDLSLRNWLLNYRHPKGRSIQIADNPILNLVFDRLMDSKSVAFKYVPEPDPDSYDGKRPEAKLHAARLGISTAFEFSPNPEGANGHRLHGIQTLLYPSDLERQLRKIASEAKSAIEETGSNMLFLVFGFLESYDSEDSERAMLAPLLSLPVTLAKGELNSDTGTYQYSVLHNGEDLADNHTLLEKMRRDFMLTLPEYREDEAPESYFARIEQTIATKRRWKVRRQLTLGMLSFGKLAIWADLDPKKHPGLLQSELVKSIFSGRDGSGGGLNAEDYLIDEQPTADHSLIFDADSSQHSAIIDVLSGQNMVINGPPGTGKSQTITNIIAAALSMGKKVLFVSEKIAALEVVRHRLNKAGLGHFCLELHSHKTQKKKFLEDIQARIEQRFPAPLQFQTKMATLQRQKVELARYAELMGSRIGNALGLTVNEVFWAAERRRQELGEVSTAVNTIGFRDASEWTHDDIQSHRARLSTLAELHTAIGGGFNENHPWWGFRPEPLAPSDDEAIDMTISSASDYARASDAAATDALEYFGFKEQPDATSASSIVETLDQIPLPSEMVEPSLLPKMFDADADPKGQHSSRLISDVAIGVEKARCLLYSAAEVLDDRVRISMDAMDEARQMAKRRKLSNALLSSDIDQSIETVSRLEKAVAAFSSAVRVSGAPYGAMGKIPVKAFISNCGGIASLGLASFSLNQITSSASAVLDTVKSLSESLTRIAFIASKRGLPFDGTPAAVANLVNPEGIPGLSSNADVSEASLIDARRLAEFPLADRSVSGLQSLKTRLDMESVAYEGALKRCRQLMERIDMTFNSIEPAIAELVAIAKVCQSAPIDLLEYRRQSFGHGRITELISEAEYAMDFERTERERFGRIFFLDALPPVVDIKSSIALLRRKDGPIAFFDPKWRKARKLHANLSREKRKLVSRDRAEELASLTAWIETRDALISNLEMLDCFGGLFRGLDTDLGKIERLNGWYISSRATLAECPGLVDKFNLTAVTIERIEELSAKATAIFSDAALLSGSEAALMEILGTDISRFRKAKATGWEGVREFIHWVIDGIAEVTLFFENKADSNLSPRHILRLMEAKADLGSVTSELECLIQGKSSLRDVGGEILGQLAELAGREWAPALEAISSQANKAKETAIQGFAFAGSDCPLGTAESFAKAKIELDEAWEGVSSLQQWNRFGDWAEMSGMAKDDAAVARMVLERISPCTKAGKSAIAVFTATDEEAEARSILDRFALSDDVRRVLGNLFDGEETNLDRLSATHAWGVAVGAAELPAAVHRRLIAPDAREALATSKHLYAEIADGYRLAREAVETLAKYGSFSWDEWQKQVRGSSSIDLPSEILTRLRLVAKAPRSVLPWSKYLSLRLQANQERLTDFVTALESGIIPPADLGSAFELSAYQSIGRSIYQEHPELSHFNGVAHDKMRADYRALDAEIISITGRDYASRINRFSKVPEGQRGTTVGDYTDMHLLRREINKKQKHIPIRQLVRRAGAALQELKPCFMMGPLSVAQYLEQGALSFDLVVMDEASQLRPEEAIGAIARGNQLVVVGDPKQLPPTNFFDRMVDGSDDEDDDEAPAAISGMESILDICQQIYAPPRSLRWHYRSHHESLIAFSNHHFYKNLIVFPSPYAKKAGLGVKYRYVRDGLYKDKQNAPEAQRVVDAVLEHMIKHPDESLGVVTLNQTQRELIEELLHKKLKVFAEGANFMTRWEAEGWPFFVKNLENVQGDERDVIFISTTFGKAPGTGSVRKTFGPISRPDGWRRLNVLFTRAKRRIELFTSMTPGDIVIEERTPRGTKVLHDYLDYAKRGVLATTDEGEREPDSDFEVSVANVITSMGYEVKPQLGVAGFFIDMAVRNPDRPGEYLAGIECDGAAYHSGFSVRDRDRIRQEILESLGWNGRIYRIWSTDWFYNPRGAIAKLQAFLEERRRISALEDSGDWEDDVVNEEMGDANENRMAEEVADAIAAEFDSTEDLFVEVGNRVTYCHLDDPNARETVLIVDSASNPKMGIINEKTPLAQALLGLSTGNVGILEVPGRVPRQLQVLKIQRR